MELKLTVKRFMQAHVGTSSTLVVGVSGGKDSMTLLHILHGLTQVSLPKTGALVVAHVHHGLRKSADRDADFVASYCQRAGIECVVTRVVVNRDAAQGVESAARSARYRALLDVASDYPSSAIVLGHHLDDQVETFLLRWLRGTGLHGLGSMREVSMREGVQVLRPFLSVSRDTIVNYASEAKLPHVDDETNDDTNYRRNYLRHAVVPKLRSAQPKIASLTWRLTQQLQTDDDYLQLQSRKLYDEIVTRTSVDVTMVDILALIEAHHSLQRRVIHLILSCFASDDWAQQHIDSILRLIAANSGPSVSVQLPSGVSAWRNYETLYIGFKRDQGTSACQRRDWDFQSTSSLVIENAGMVWRFRRVRLQTDWHRLMRKSRQVDLSRLFLPDISGIVVHTGVPTDCKVRPLGLGGSKKLQDVFTDAKVPRHLRAHWPVFMIGGELLWLPGLVRSDSSLLGEKDEVGWVVVAYANERVCREVRTWSDNPPRIIRE